MRTDLRHLLVPLLLTTMSCSGANKPATGVPSPAETVTAPVEQPAEELDPGEGLAWHDKSHEQQEAFMKLTVKPKMASLFQTFDAETFADFKCSTCHGENARERNFEMPSPDLPKIDFEHWEKDHPKEMEFMKNIVVPEMAALLGEEPYNPKTKEGFGCSGCHQH